MPRASCCLLSWQPCAIPLARLLKLGAHDKQRVPDEFELSSFNPRPSLDGAHLEPIAKRRQLTKQAESGRFIGLFQLACVGQPRKMELSSFLRWCNRPVPSCSSELSLHFSRLEFPALLNQDVCAMDSYRSCRPDVGPYLYWTYLMSGPWPLAKLKPRPQPPQPNRKFWGMPGELDPGGPSASQS